MEQRRIFSNLEKSLDSLCEIFQIAEVTIWNYSGKQKMVNCHI